MGLPEIPGYEVIEELGSGGMAVVYLAYKTGAAGFKRPVVLKRITRQTGESRKMFIDEARLASKIQHRAVVRVEELCEVGDEYFMVMEYVHGVTLAEVLTELGRLKRRLSPPAVVSIICEVADGLHAAHEARDDEGKLLGLVHRDVSPQNIMVAANGAVKVIDFGVVKARERLTESIPGSQKGKLRYMSPEQVSGADVDRRSDIFSLGVVMWESLTNRRLFSGTDLDATIRIMKGQASPPSKLAPSVSPDLDAFVLRCLSVKPENRPQSAREMRNELRSIVADSKDLSEEVMAALLIALAGPRLDELASRVSATSGLDTIEASTAPYQAYATLTEGLEVSIPPLEAFDDTEVDEDDEAVAKALAAVRSPASGSELASAAESPRESASAPESPRESTVPFDPEQSDTIELPSHDARFRAFAIGAVVIMAIAIAIWIVVNKS